MATAYTALALFCASLVIGPIAGIRGRRYPVSTDLRRDIGIWAAIVALTHVVIGLQVHLRGKMWQYFAHSVNGAVLPRFDPFGLANYTGAIAALIFAVLLVTSNDASLRKLGVERWRRIHSLTAWGLILTALHGVAYQFVESRGWPLVTTLAVVLAAALWLRFVRSRSSESAPRITR
jgi:sulfoxide reductase heme-binding subunit YedZ